MAAAFISFSHYLKPSPRYGLNREVNLGKLSRASLSPLSRHEPLAAGWMDLRRSSPSIIGNRKISFGRTILPLAAHEELNHSDIDVDKQNELRSKDDETREAWKQTLESFKIEAMKMKGLSQEAYEVYSKRAIKILKETSEALKIQADKARDDLDIITKELSQEGQIYISAAVEKSPESVKDILETFASFPRDLKEVLTVKDFYFGVPYGVLLAIGGFLNFMVTGSIPAIRFGVILGSTLLALSILSLRSWKCGQSSEWSLKGQTAIATIIFVRESRLFSKIRSFPTFLTTILSGAMVAFYVYRILVDDLLKILPSPAGKSSEFLPNLDESSEI